MTPTRVGLARALGLAPALWLAMALAGCGSMPQPGDAPAATAAAPSASPAAAAATDDLGCTLPSNCVSSHDGGLPALAFAGTPEQAMAALKATLAGYPAATVVNAAGLRLAAVFTTPAGFRDAVDFRIDTPGQRIDFRSRSLLGLFDFGKNRARMRDFSARFAAAAEK